jgi:hypothetical protein
MKLIKHPNVIKIFEVLAIFNIKKGYISWDFYMYATDFTKTTCIYL